MGNCISGVKIGDFSKIKTLPLELQVEVFSYLRPSELRAVCLTDKIRNQIINRSDLKKESIYRDFAFNSGDWKKFCKKDVDMEKERSSLPRDIWSKLNSPCPVFFEPVSTSIWGGFSSCRVASNQKRIGQTHMLVWIPKKVGGETLTLNSFGKVLREYFPDNNLHNGYKYLASFVEGRHGEVGIAKSGWVLMTKDVVPGSKNTSYVYQKQLLRNVKEISSYEVPKTIEAIVCISTKYFKSKQRLFVDKPLAYTRCQGLEEDRFPVYVGKFSEGGLGVYSSRFDLRHSLLRGFAVLRRLDS